MSSAESKEAVVVCATFEAGVVPISLICLAVHAFYYGIALCDITLHFNTVSFN